MVNSLRLAANRDHYGVFVPKTLDQAGVGAVDIGIKAFTYTPHAPVPTVTGGFNLNSNGGPTHIGIFALNDDLSVLRGNHQVAFGVSASAWWVNSYSGTYHMRYTFNGATTGLGMADYFMGYASQFVNGPVAAQHKRSKYIGVYGADTWKVNQRLTFNYGLRWEPFFPLINQDGSALHFDIDAFRKGVRTNRFTNTPPGLFFNGDPGFPGLAGQYNQWKNFSPRVGLAWDVAGDGRTSVRASGGLTYDYPSSHYQSGLSAAPPWLPRYTLNDVDFENPWANWPGGDPFPLPYGHDVGRDAAWPLYGIVTAMDYDTPTMQVSQWNLSLQKQIGADWLVSASYLGSATTHLWNNQQINPAVFLGLGPCTLNGVNYPTCSTTANTEQRRRLVLENPNTGQYYGYIVRIDSGGTASYNGMLLSIERRAARSVTVSGNYTWSHCISDPGGDELGGTSGSPNRGWNNPDIRRSDRGNCTVAAADRRHLFNLSAVAVTPQFSNATLRAVGSGWRLSPIFRVISGGYMSVTTNQDRALNGISNQRVNQILPNPYGDKSVNNYLNPSAFALPAMGTLGNMGISNIVGPGTWQFDTALSRTFRVRETQKLEFRAEAFNVTNAFRMNNPTTNLNSNVFGQVTSAKDPRIMQFALKYVF